MYKFVIVSNLGHILMTGSGYTDGFKAYHDCVGICCVMAQSNAAYQMRKIYIVTETLPIISRYAR